MQEDGRASSQFFPSHFTSTGDSMLKLAEGVSLDKELEIVLDSYYPCELPLEA